jgi:PAS domain S-box-containing protein
MPDFVKFIRNFVGSPAQPPAFDPDRERLLYLAEYGSGWFWETDTDHRLTMLIGALVDPRKVMGMTREELSTARDLQETGKWDRYRAALARREPFDDFVCEIEGPATVSKTGKTAWISVSGQPRLDEQGNFAGYRGTGNNVTRRVRETRHLEDTLERFHLFVEHSPAAVFIQQDRVIKYLNKAAVDLFDIEDPELMIGQSISSLILDERRDAFERRYQAALAGEHPPFMESRVVTQTGKQKFVESSIYRTEWDGETALISVFHDITDRKLAETGLEESRKELLGIMNGLADGVILVDEHGIMINLNLAAHNIFGYQVGEVDGEAFSTLLPVNSLFHDTAYTTRYIAEEAPKVLGKKIMSLGRKSNGTTFPMRLVMSALPEGELQSGRLIVSCIDISREREMEEALFQAQKMEAVGHLTGGIAHDFNNLLQVISGATSVIQTEFPEDDQRRQFITLIERSVTKGASLTSQLLSFARQQSLQPEPSDVTGLVRDMEEVVRRIFNENIDFEITTEAEVPQVMIDGHALHNAILNLCINAQAAMPEGGKLTIQLSNMELTEDLAVGDEVVSAGKFVDITVSDSGVGMSPFVLESAFDPFFSTRPIGEGSGLGLSMVYGFARQSGGYCHIESTERIGTSVHLVLPEHRETSNR